MRALRQVGSPTCTEWGDMSRSQADKITNKLHESLQEAMRSVLTTEALLASFFEGRFKKAGVRLSEVERERVREAAAEYLRTNEISVLESAVKRRRNIHIEITDSDIDQFIPVRTAQERTIL